MTPEGKRHTNKMNDLIDKIIHMRINECKTRLNIYDYLVKDLKYDDTTAYYYMKLAREETDRRAVQNFGEDLKEDIERFEADREAAIKRGDHKEASNLLRDISKLKGHYVERQDITSANQPITEIKIVKVNGVRLPKKDTEDDNNFFDSLD